MQHQNTSIDEIAAGWVVRCDRGRLTAEEASMLDAWLAADRRHLGAYARAQAVSVHFNRARALHGAPYDPMHFRVAAAQPVDPTRRRLLWLGGALATAAAVGLASVAIVAPSQRRYNTQLGEVLRLPLPDGSVVTLNSATQLVVEFSAMRRLVYLMRGEALFDVAADALRPFVVQAEQACVEAVETSFSVQRVANTAIEVVVHKGSVDLDVDGGLTRGPLLRLAANTVALASPDRRVEVVPLQPMEVERRLAWREGMISFDGDSLAQAAAQFARYSDTHIVIADPAIGRLSVVGLYSATNPIGFARAVALSMNLRVELHGETVRLLASR